MSDQAKRGRDKRLHGKQEALLVAFACNDAPEGRESWTMPLLAELKMVEQHSYEEIKVEKPNQYTLMVEEFADSILNKTAPRFPIEDSIGQMYAIDKLYAATKTH